MYVVVELARHIIFQWELFKTLRSHAVERATSLFQARSRGSIPIWDLEGELTGSRAFRLKEALLDFFNEGNREGARQIYRYS